MPPRTTRAVLAVACLVAVALAGCTQDAPPQPTRTTTSTTPGTSTTTLPRPTTTGPGATPEPTYGSAGSGVVPRLTIGDFWVWVRPADGTNVTERAEVEAFERIFLEGTAYSAIRLNMTVTVGDQSAPYVRWVRESDLALLKEEHGEGMPGAHQMVVTTTWNPPCEGIYPLRVGLAATRSCTVRSVRTSPQGPPVENLAYDNGTFSIPAKERLETPAGAFEAFRIEKVATQAGGEIQHTSWFSGRACANVREESEGREGATVLVSYRCALGVT